MTNKGGAYVHIPFCRKKCNYCDFYSLACDSSLIENYVSVLVRQIMTDRPDFAFSTAYLGGGTPSLLTPDQLTRIVSALLQVGGKPEELTVEVNPESVSLPFLQAAKDCGVNRISMGIQCLDDTVLHRLGRLADRKTCFEAYDAIRSIGFDNVSLDLMLAVPGQTEQSLAQTLAETVSLEPEHLSAYLLKVEPNTPFGRAGVTEADEETQRRYYLHTHDVLCAHGYEHYEISNFAKPGYKARHNSSYWQSVPYAAYGSGAYGFDGKIRYHIAPDIKAFITADGRPERITDQVMDDASLREEHVMLALRTSDGLEDSCLTEAQKNTMETLLKAGLCRRTQNGYALTAEGYLVSDSIIVSLL